MVSILLILHQRTLRPKEATHCLLEAMPSVSVTYSFFHLLVVCSSFIHPPTKIFRVSLTYMRKVTCWVPQGQRMYRHSPFLAFILTQFIIEQVGSD